MISDLEKKFEIETTTELRHLINALFIDIRQNANCGSIYGSRKYISFMIQNESKKITFYYIINFS